MSQYICFFVKTEDNKFYPIGSYSRSSAIYEMFDDNEIGPWEKVEAITEKKLECVKRTTDGILNRWYERKRSIEEKLELVKSFNGSIEARIEMWDDLKDELFETESMINELKEVHSFIWFLEQMIYEMKWEDRYGINENEYIYAGIEIGYPTVDDVVEGVYD